MAATARVEWSLREVNGRLPPITLKRKTQLILGSKNATASSHTYSRSRDDAHDTGTTTHILRHPHIASVHCAIDVDRAGMPTVHHANDLMVNGIGSHSAYVNGQRLPPTTWRKIGQTTLQLGDVLTFVDDPIASADVPAFIVVERFRRPTLARDDSTATFSLLALDPELLLSCVLPCLPLGSLARLALVSAECAALVVQHVVGKHRWAGQSAAIVASLAQVDSRSMLLATTMGPVQSYVDIGETALWRLNNFTTRKELSENRHPIYGQHRSFTLNNEDIEEDSEQNGAAWVLIELIPAVESLQLCNLFKALAVRLQPAPLVQLLNTLCTTTALRLPWLHQYGYFRYGHEDPDAPQPRLQADQVEWHGCAAATAWTPELVVTLGKAIGSTGFQLGEQVGRCNMDLSARRAIAALWIAEMGDAEAAEFLVGFHQLGDRLVEAAASLASEVASFSLPLLLHVFDELDERAHNDAEDALRSQGYDDFLAGEVETYAALPSDVLRSWSDSVDFPNEYSLEQVHTVVQRMRRSGHALTQPYFGQLGHKWILDLLGGEDGASPREAGVAPEMIEKVRVISSALSF